MSTPHQGRYRFEHGQIITVTLPTGVKSRSWPSSQRENLTMRVVHATGAGAWDDCDDRDFITADWYDGHVNHPVTIKVAWIVDRQPLSPDTEVSTEEAEK